MVNCLVIVHVYGLYSNINSIVIFQLLWLKTLYTHYTYHLLYDSSGLGEEEVKYSMFAAWDFEVAHLVLKL